MPTPERMSARDIDEYISKMGRGPAVDAQGQPTEDVVYTYDGHGVLVSVDRKAKPATPPGAGGAVQLNEDGTPAVVDPATGHRPEHDGFVEED